AMPLSCGAMDQSPLQHPVTKLRLKLKPQLTTREVADRAGVDRTSLIKVEHGDRHRLGVDSCRALVTAFPGDLKLDQLLDWKWPELQKKEEAARKAKRAA